MLDPAASRSGSGANRLQVFYWLNLLFIERLKCSKGVVGPIHGDILGVGVKFRLTLMLVVLTLRI